MSERLPPPPPVGRSTPGIDFDHVWKKFRRGEVHDSLRDLIPAVARRLAGRAPSVTELTNADDFWALRDVSFQVRPGEALGIIGANGAGKSTVLKTLTKILRPTRGRCEVRGRVGALIEISAGFHLDLSGRENVFLQGAIMGMRRAEIEQKFDEIVDFAAIGDFIDTPVKRYSSGMNARLGFAVAAHLDPDVLIIDEVLAVGDIKFQQKAYDRIQQMVRSGIPVVVVSHQLDRIISLCTHGILLERGAVARQGTPSEVVAAFVNEQGAPQHGGMPAGDEPIRFESVTVDGEGVPSGERVTLTVAGEVRPESPMAEHVSVGVRVRGLRDGWELFRTNSTVCHVPLPEAGRFSLDIDLQMNVPAGVYAVETCAWSDMGELELYAGPIVHVHVLPGTNFWGYAQLNPHFRVTSPVDASRLTLPRRRAGSAGG